METHFHRNRHGYVTGIMLVLAGLIFFLDGMDIIHLGRIYDLWPLILVALGIRKMIVGHSPRRFPKGSMMIFLGIWLYVCINHIWGLSFHEMWPAVLIAGGITMVWKGMYPRERCKDTIITVP